MAEGCGREPGGIFGVLTLCDEHGEALESDLIDRGLRLRDVGTQGFTWNDLIVIIRQIPEKSALMRSKHPDIYNWGQAEHLLADIFDVASLLLWAKTKDGQKNRNRPDPYPRPGVEKPERIGDKANAISVDEMNAWLGW